MPRSQEEVFRLPDHSAIERLRRGLLMWYGDASRELPWRLTSDPYRILLSEVMLQQTRVDQAEGYYLRFVERFPSLEALARADLDEVLSEWEGLGYYSRARSLHRAARIMIDRHGGVPDSYEALLDLPGIGPYTAAAVTSIAFGLPYAALDGNVMRVLARLFAIGDDLRAATTRRLMQHISDRLLDPNAPGDFNQAMMELGATVCLPKRPTCEACPLVAVCSAATSGRQDLFPFKSRRPPVPHFDVVVACIRDDEGRFLITRRPEDGLLGGLWEFPGGKRADDESLEHACRREIREELGVDIVVGDRFHRLAHAYSHFKITLHAFDAAVVSGIPATRNGMPLKWVKAEDLDGYAFPRANRKLITFLRSGREYDEGRPASA